MTFKDKYYKLPRGTNATISPINNNLIFFSFANYIQKCKLTLNNSLSYFIEYENNDFTYKYAINQNKYLVAMQGNISVIDE